MNKKFSGAGFRKRVAKKLLKEENVLRKLPKIKTLFKLVPLSYRIVQYKKYILPALNVMGHTNLEFDQNNDIDLSLIAGIILK